MSETFKPGQTVFRKSDGQQLTFASYSSPTLQGSRPLCYDASDYLVCPPLTDITATDPNAEPLPQKCPFCGSKAEVFSYANTESNVRCLDADRKPGSHGCTFKSPYKPTRLEAVQAWNSIRIVSLTNPRPVPVEWVPKLPADSDPLTEEWLRKVGLWDGFGGFRRIRLIANRGDFDLDVVMDTVCVSSQTTTCKTIGDARQLCRLLGVPLKE